MTIYSPHAEQVTDADISQHDESTTANALDGSARDDHGQVDGQRADQAADEEDEVGHQQDGLAAPDVADLAPEGDAGRVGEQIGRGHPGVAALGGVEVRRHGWERGGDDGLESSARRLRPMRLYEVGRDSRAYHVKGCQEQRQLNRLSACILPAQRSARADIRRAPA